MELSVVERLEGIVTLIAGHFPLLPSAIACSQDRDLTSTAKAGMTWPRAGVLSAWK
jgi:hypothetical protein